MVRDVFERGAKVDLALLSVGELTHPNTVTQVGLISNAEATSLMKSGAVGDIGLHWIDAAGEVIDHPLNRRVIALPPSKLKNIPCIILASGGRSKVTVLYGALFAGFVKVLVTDEQTARGVLDRADGRRQPLSINQSARSPFKPRG
jgi:DNA-binding transcriptional regulator LsrR (DeoR family)